MRSFITALTLILMRNISETKQTIYIIISFTFHFVSTHLYKTHLEIWMPQKPEMISDLNSPLYLTAYWGTFKGQKIKHRVSGVGDGNCVLPHQLRRQQWCASDCQSIPGSWLTDETPRDRRFSWKAQAMTKLSVGLHFFFVDERQQTRGVSGLQCPTVSGLLFSH